MTIVGPDGVGKSTLRFALSEALSMQHETSTDRSVGPVRGARSTADGGSQEQLSTPMSLVKLVYLWLDEWLRWTTTVRSMVVRGGWIVSERGWWDLAVVPHRYRMHALPRLHRLLSAFVPLPGLLIVLEAPAAVVSSRKGELPQEEIVRQVAGWHTIPSGRQKRVFIAADQPAEAVLADVALAAADVLDAPCPTLERLTGQS